LVWKAGSYDRRRCAASRLLLPHVIWVSSLQSVTNSTRFQLGLGGARPAKESWLLPPHPISIVPSSPYVAQLMIGNCTSSLLEINLSICAVIIFMASSQANIFSKFLSISLHLPLLIESFPAARTARGVWFFTLLSSVLS